MAEAVLELPPMEKGLTVNSPPVDIVGEELSIGEIIDGGRRFHLNFIAIGGHDQPTEPDGTIGQACQRRLRFALGLGLALAAMPAMAHAQAIETDPQGREPYCFAGKAGRIRPNYYRDPINSPLRRLRWNRQCAPREARRNWTLRGPIQKSLSHCRGEVDYENVS
ncbi:protein of unknown function [Methylocella tundrae]|uniref:Uncharacterized protein n=1 Tax=Methylocella tundrae TaxID=227605 RepID=A0A4U8YWY9_METTU|nr:protein of unknown function [Methylocella tundrae]